LSHGDDEWVTAKGHAERLGSRTSMDVEVDEGNAVRRTNTGGVWWIEATCEDPGHTAEIRKW